MKVIVLTRGDLAGAAGKRNAETIHSYNGCRNVSVNCKKSAEAIVPKLIFFGKGRTMVVFKAKEGEAMHREQKTAKAGWTCENRVELEGNKGARSIVEPKNVEKDGAESLIEEMLQRDNLNAAYLRVKQNKGAAGIDKMTVEEMLPYLKEHKEELVRAIKEGTYQLKPVRRVEIDKPDGGKRMLGIPTVIDRMVQQALAQVLQPIFERSFRTAASGFGRGEVRNRQLCGQRNITNKDIAK